MRHARLALLLAGLVLPVAAWAEDASPPSSAILQVEVARKRHVVRPVPSPAAVADDADRAQAAARDRAREEQLIRQQRAPASRRPDLDRDVVSGIQARNLHKALGR
jgi:hypothetical protein